MVKISNDYDPDYVKCPRCGIYMLKPSDPRILEVGVCSDCYYDLQEEYYKALGAEEPPKYTKK